MARRRFTIIFTILGFALFVVDAPGFLLLYLPSGASRLLRSNSTLVLQRRRRPRRGRRRPTSSATSAASKTPTVRVDRRQPAQGQGRRARVVASCSSRPASSRRSGARCRRSATRCSTSGSRASRSTRTWSTAATASTTSRRRPTRCFLMPSSPLDLTRRRHLRAVPARHARQDRRLSRPAPHRRLQDGGEHVHREGLHARAQGDGRVAQPRSVRADRARHRRRPEEERGRRPHGSIDEGPFLPEDALRAGLVDDVAYEDQVEEKLRGRRAGGGARSTATTTRAISASSLGLNRGPRDRA